MPEKEGAEEKSTKSVVKKKQKQMMGEEGYDIARDMGRVRPSKDKKDATTMPVSDEVKKTQKINKGPSAFELVKKKYGKAVMNVGKKKANEELDLTQVAEALGGYIVEAPLKSLTGDPEEIASKIKKGAAKVTRERQKKAEKNLAKDAGIKLVTQSPEKAAATQAAKDIGVDNLTPDVRRGMRSTAADRGLDEPEDESVPTSGGKRKGKVKAPSLSPTSGGRKIRKKISPSQKEAELEGKRKDYLDPKTNKASPEGVKKYITKARQMRSGSNVPVDQETTDNIAKIAGKEYADKINQKYGGRRAGRRQSTATPPAFATRTGESGGPLPVSMRNRRVPKTSSLSPNVKVTSIVKPTVGSLARTDQETSAITKGGTDFKALQDKIKNVSLGKGMEVVDEPKTRTQGGRIGKDTGRTVDTTATEVKPDQLTGSKPRQTALLEPPKGVDPYELLKLKNFKKTETKPQPETKKGREGESETIRSNPTGGGKGGGKGGGNKIVTTGRGGKGKPFKDFATSLVKLTRDNPVASLIGYDQLKNMQNPFSIKGGRSGMASARGGGGL